jgi:hypothetical protein
MFLMPSMQNQNGFLMNLIYLNPAAFSQYGLGLGELRQQSDPQW